MMPTLLDNPIGREQPFGLEDNGRLMTVDEFDAAAAWDEHYAYELVHGVLIVSPMAGPGETSPNDGLGFLLRAYQRFHAEGRCLDDTLPEFYVRTKDSRRRADRAVWIGLGRAPQPRTDVPTIIIEFVARSHRDRRRDYVEKRAEYAEIGVEEYWVIDRHQRKLTVYFRDNSTQTFEPDDTYRTPRLPGFEMPLDEIFAAADRYPEN